MTPSLPETHLEAWRRLYVSFWRVCNAAEAGLQAAGRPPLSWYDALYALYLAPGRRLRMSELARGALLSKSGLTRLVDRLEKEKLITRRTCPADGRVQHIELTPRGVGTLREIWAVYRGGIARQFAAHLTETDARDLTRILAKVTTATDPANEGQP
ncbi:MAG: MarR family transcriptional regulator [Opitutaceae bacterium]|nr:MarR family transcriptional regulator [Opitutaceae bacterium]